MSAVPQRRRNLALLAVVPVVVAALVGALGLLLPAPGPEPVADGGATTGIAATLREATCAQPRPAASPVLVRSGSLFACPESFDGRAVVVRGEAIGELLRGPDGRRWVQVNDDAYATAGPLPTTRRPQGTNSGVAVLLPAGIAPGSLGGPGRQGDLVQVEGIYRATAAEDQGGPAVIARALSVERPGGAVAVIPATRLRIVTPLAAAATAALVLAAWRRRR